MSVLLCSDSKLKVEATKQFFASQQISVTIETFNCGDCGLPNQPICNYNTNGLCFAKERMNFCRKHKNFDEYDYVVSIENVVDTSFEKDHAFALIYSRGNFGNGVSTGAQIPDPFMKKLKAQPDVVYANDRQGYSNHLMKGYDKEIGTLINEFDPDINPKNWIKSMGCAFDRVEQIIEALTKAFALFKEMYESKQELSLSFTKYPDFPKPGVLFEDMFPLFSDRNKLYMLVKNMAQTYAFDRIECVVGLESRGFVLGAVLAYELNTSFVPIRKAGKLPGEVIQVSYKKEYGSDTCEIAKNSIVKGTRVLIIDDLIATGGSMRAACDLVEKCGGVIVDCCILKNVPSLKDKCDTTMTGQQYTVLFQ